VRQPSGQAKGTGMKKPLMVSLLAIAVLSAAPGKRKFTGVVTDSMCASADHAA